MKDHYEEQYTTVYPDDEQQQLPYKLYDKRQPFHHA